MHFDFLIADHRVRVEDEILSSLLTGFESDSESKSAPDGYRQGPICSIRIASEPPLHGVERLDTDHPISHVLAMTRFKSAVLLADDCFENITVRHCSAEGLSDTLLLAIYSRLTYFHTVFVHGALVDIPNLGCIMFTGRSGVGKTTQAKLWEEHCGAEIINGDKVFLSVKSEDPDHIYAYGSPWRGSSPYCVNKRLPLRAIVDLTRDSENYIRRLDDTEALMYYMPSVFMPNWDVRLTGMVMDTLDVMMPRVPIYRMSCGPDDSGMHMVRRALLAH